MLTRSALHIPLVLIFIATIAGAADRTDRDRDGEPGEAWAIRQRARAYLARHGRDAELRPADQLARSRWGYGAWLEQQAERRTKGVEGEGWVSLGPSHGAGRMPAIAPHPSRIGVVAAGAAGGGLWLTEDDGMTWRPLTDGLPDLSVGAVAWAPSAPDTLYIGSGEGGFAQDFIPGIGLLRSDDGGETWWLPDHVVASQFYALSVDPRDPDRVVAATNQGLLETTDGGSSFHALLPIGSLNAVTEVLRSSANPDRLWAALWCTSTCPVGLGRVMRSDDGGVTWDAASDGLAPAYNFDPSLNRLALAVAPSDPNRLYVALNTGERIDSVPIVATFRSDDGGDSWSRQTDAGIYLGVQGWYDNALTVDPHDHNRVIGAGMWYVVSDDGGLSWTERNPYDNGGDGMGGDGLPHVDGHDLQWQGDRLWLGCDGGVWISDDGGVTWQPRNTGLITRQYYGLALDPIRRDRILGGTQDNGSDLRLDAGAEGWVDVIGSDGFECAINPLLPDVMFGSIYQTTLYRSINGGVGEWRDISPPAVSEASPFVTPLTINPDRPWEIYTGRSLVWVSRDAGDTWTSLRSEVQGGGSWSADTVSSVAVADGGAVVLAAKAREVYSSNDSGRSWWPHAFPAAVNHVEVSPFDSATAFAGLTLPPAGTASLWRTMDGGVTWHESATGLPPFAVQVVRSDPTDSQQVFAGTDVGVYRSTDGGVTWSSYGDGLPSASVHDIRILPDGSMLRIATHGRGIWELEIPRIENQNPVLTEVMPATREIHVATGEPVEFSASAVDPDGDPVTMTWVMSGRWETAQAGPTQGPTSTSISHRFEHGGSWPAGIHVVDDKGGAAFASFEVTVREPGDDCATARVVPPAGPFPFVVLTENLTTGEAGSDPMPPCTDTNSDPLAGRWGSIWFSFTPAASGRYFLTTCGSRSDTILSVWTGPSCGPFQLVAGGCNDDDGFQTCSAERSSSALDLDLEAGTTYRILVGSWADNTRSVVRFTVECSSCSTIEPPLRWTVPAAAHSPGSAGTVWRTDLDIANLSAEATTARLRFLPRDSARPPTTPTTVMIPSGATIRYPDVVATAFGSEGSGAIDIVADRPLVATSRTYNDSVDGTFGQGIPAVRAGHEIQPGGIGRFIGIEGSGRFRTNLGIANPGPDIARIRVELEDETGDRATRTDLEVPGTSWHQIDRLFTTERIGTTLNPRAIVRNVSGTAPVILYASVVDQNTGDPSYLEPVAVAPAGAEMWVAAAVHADGVGGTTWRTDLVLSSIENTYTDLQLSFLPAAGGSPVERQVIVPRDETVRYEDVVAQLFETTGGGAIRIEVSRGYLGASSRTFTVTTQGSFGQSIPAVTEESALTTNQIGALVGLHQGNGFRTNIGFANLGDDALAVEVKALAVDGSILGQQSWTVDGAGWYQANRPLPAGTATATVVSHTAGARYLAYASVVDDRSGDPTYIAAVVVD
jgi:photosystem II stability/assembly factor-like uncharacterized protein